MDNSSSSSDDEEQLVPNIVINRYLKCRVCKEFTVNPIYTCKNGHNVCGICQEKTTTCPTCKAKHLIANKFIERILRREEVLLPCRNSHHGCTLKIKPSDMKDHLKSSCDFRPIKCTETGCEGKSYTPKDLFQHWVDVHKNPNRVCQTPTVTTPGNITNLIGTICNGHTISTATFNKMTELNQYNVSWNPGYFELDNRKFFIHVRSLNKTIHHWITLLGEESDAECYNFSTTISNVKSDLSKSAKKVIEFREIPIHSLQYYDLAKVDALGHTVAVKCNSLAMLQDKQPIDMLVWTTKIEIHKVPQDSLVN